MKKKLPKLTSDAEAEAFIDNADLTEFDLSTMRELRFEFGPKTERINIRAVLEQAVARRERSK
jgi:predicted DNA binding CopG/RHH family protein